MEKPTKQCTPEILAQLIAYRDDRSLTISDLSRELGYHVSAVSKYLAGRPECDIPRLEGIILDVIRNAALREKDKPSLFETQVTRQINSVFETIRKTNDVGLVHAPAGVGKTCGIELYVANNPSAIALTATRYKRDEWSISTMLFGAVDTRRYDHQTNRMEWLAERLRQSNRLIIFDNAHKLTRSALELVFDFHDDTGCPIALVGNPDVLEHIRKNDQLFSRIGLKRELKIRSKEAIRIAQQVVEQHWPEANGDLAPLAQIVVEQLGHMRALRKQVRLAKEIAQAGGMKPVDAFRAAHTQLVRDYKLEDK